MNKIHILSLDKLLLIIKTSQFYLWNSYLSWDNQHIMFQNL